MYCSTCGTKLIPYEDCSGMECNTCKLFIPDAFVQELEDIEYRIKKSKLPQRPKEAKIQPFKPQPFKPCRPNNFKTHRPWTAEEAIGKCVMFNGDDIGWIQITATDLNRAYGHSCLGPWSETYEMLLDRYIQEFTNSKTGDICGVFLKGLDVTVNKE